MMQIASGLAITEDRNFIRDDDIEWIIRSSQLSPRYEKKISDQAAVGIVNGLAVTGPNSGMLLDIEVQRNPVTRWWLN